MAYSIPKMEFVANVVLASMFGLTVIDVMLVFSSIDPIEVSRDVNNRLNLGDENKVTLTVKNTTEQPINFTMIEGYPVEMQERSSVLKGTILGHKDKIFQYNY